MRGEKRVLGKHHEIPVKVGENLMEAIDEDLNTTGPHFDFELWQPERKDHREIPDNSKWDRNGNWGIILAIFGPRWFTWTWHRTRQEAWARCRDSCPRFRMGRRTATSYGGTFRLATRNLW